MRGVTVVIVVVIVVVGGMFLLSRRSTQVPVTTMTANVAANAAR